MDADRDEIHSGTDAARAGSTPNIVRWILVVSLFAAIALLSIIWMTGAATQEEGEEHVNVSSRMNEQQDAAGNSTDSIVSDRGFDEIETAEPGQADPARTTPNEQETQ